LLAGAQLRLAEEAYQPAFLYGMRGERAGIHLLMTNIEAGKALRDGYRAGIPRAWGEAERYIDQLNLLRTVGRLGRTSKRRHVPGTPLSIVVHDGDLVISRGHNRIPVRGICHVLDISDINHPRKVAEYPVPEGGAHNIWVEDGIMYMGYYSGGGRVVDVSGELRGDLYRQGREIGRVWTGAPDGYRVNLPFTWGAQPHRGLIYFNDINSGLWVMKLGPKIDKGSTTAPGQ
jgi:hypothetical protein